MRQVFTGNVLERNLSPEMMHFLINDLQCTIFKILHSLGEISLDEERLKKELEALSRERELLNRFQHINGIFRFLCEKICGMAASGSADRLYRLWVHSLY